MTHSNDQNPATSVSQQELRNANQDYRDAGFGEMEERLHVLMDMLADLLGDSANLAKSMPWRGQNIEDQAKEPDEAADTAQLQAICFEILNMVEELRILFTGIRTKMIQKLSIEYLSQLM